VKGYLKLFVPGIGKGTFEGRATSHAYSFKRASAKGKETNGTKWEKRRGGFGGKTS